ncbi:MAG: sigma-70 family RNA polymerase sigma factor [Planctomycetes bacterium]|nr:sigma-70 family RNA polymerase sigma factor [Planctomycetota bacterium]
MSPEPRRDECAEAYGNRVGTALMAFYRDSRDPSAFEALHALTGPGVLHWIRGLTGRELTSLDPAEILQDTFVNVYRYPGAFRADHCGSFRVWVRTIAGNVVRRAALLRARSAERELAEPSELEDKASGPMQAVLEEDESERLRRAWVLLLCYYAEAWKELSQRDRRTLHLVEVEGLSYQEAGRILAVGRSNMKMIVFRSRRRIARRMLDAMGCARGRAVPELVA